MVVTSFGFIVGMRTKLGSISSSFAIVIMTVILFLKQKEDMQKLSKGPVLWSIIDLRKKQPLILQLPLGSLRAKLVWDHQKAPVVTTAAQKQTTSIKNLF